MKTSYFAIIELPKEISLGNCAMGIKVSGQIGDHKFDLETPKLIKAGPKTPESEKYGLYTRNLAPPKSAKELLKQPEKIYWGQPIQCDKNGKAVASVKHLLAVFPDQVEDADEFSKTIYLSNSEWIERFDSFLRITSEQRTFGATKISGPINTHFQLYQAQPTQHLKAPTQTIRVSLFHHKPYDCASRNELKQAVKFCSQNMQLALQYQLLLKAYDAHQITDSRTIVIEASTALEVAATRRIRMILEKDKVPKKHIEVMLKGHQTLTNRMKLLKTLGVKIPLNEGKLRDEVITIRNKVIHGGYVVEARVAEKLLFHTQNIIREITPEFAVPKEV